MLVRQGEAASLMLTGATLAAYARKRPKQRHPRGGREHVFALTEKVSK